MSFRRSEANQAFVFAGCAGVLLIICIICIVIALRCRKRKKDLADDASVAAHAMTPVGSNSAFPAAFNATPMMRNHSGANISGPPSYAHGRTASAAPTAAQTPGYVQNKVQGDLDELAQWQAEALAKREMPPVPGQKATKIEYDSDDESHPKNRARLMPGYQLQTYDQAPPEF
jgi:hypothetical protein